MLTFSVGHPFNVFKKIISEVCRNISLLQDLRESADPCLMDPEES